MQAEAVTDLGIPAGGALARPAWLTHLAHDLRGPLSPLSTALALLRSGRLDSHQQLETCGMAQQQLEILVQLLDDTAELLARRPRGRAAPLELASLLDMARVRVARRVQAAGCTLSVKAAAVPAVEGEQRSLLRLVSGLLLRCADIAGPGAQLVVELSEAGAPVLSISLYQAESQAAARCAALAATLTDSSQIHVADAALAGVISVHQLQLQALPGDIPGLLLRWPQAA